MMRLFKKKPKQTKDSFRKEDFKGTIFYHEDDYCQIEILPNENLSKLIKEAEVVHTFEKEHADGAGYSDIRIRDDVEFKLNQRQIQVSELKELLSMLDLEEHNKVSTGISPNEMESKNTIGYGENYGGIFFDFENNVVSNIWISGPLKANNELILKVLNDIGKTWNLLLMDWNSLSLIDLREEKFIQKYLN